MSTCRWTIRNAGFPMYVTARSRHMDRSRSHCGLGAGQVALQKILARVKYGDVQADRLTAAGTRDREPLDDGRPGRALGGLDRPTGVCTRRLVNGTFTRRRGPFRHARILVNELANLEHLLRILPTILASGGRGRYQFHSGEDRLVALPFKWPASRNLSFNC